MVHELDEIFGVIDKIELHESASIAVEQRDDEITFTIAGIVCINFELTAEQALRLSAAGNNAAKFLASTDS